MRPVAALLLVAGLAGESTQDTPKEPRPRAATAPPVTALAFSPDGREVLVGSQRGIEVRSWPGLEPRRRLETELRHVHDLRFSPDGERVAAGGGKPAEEGAVEVFGWPDGRRLYRRVPHEDLVYGVAWSPDSKRWACASYDRTAGIHDARDGRRIHEIRGHSRAVLAVCFTADGRFLVTAGVDRSLRLWNAESAERRRVLENHTLTVNDLSSRPRERPDALPMIASVSHDRTLRLWQPTIGRLVRFVRFESRALAVEWSADGRRAIVACADGHVRSIDPETVEVVEDLAALDGWAHSLAAAPRGREVVVGGDAGQLKRLELRR
ncbi:MAG: WD40 repeat domain-containing protein [Planctomycetota bacterium]|nr:WD40 repeat domain-containing protein [Planctomycetota bacterium]